MTDNPQFEQIVTHLRADRAWWQSITLIWYTHQAQLAEGQADSLNQHPGELCTCGHPIGDHTINDQTVGYCLECNCPAYDDAYEGVW